MKKLFSLRFKITGLVALSLSITAGLLMFVSVYSSQVHFVKPQQRTLDSYAEMDKNIIYAEVIAPSSNLATELVPISQAMKAQENVVAITVAAQNSFQTTQIWVTLVILLGATGLTYLLVGHALKPLQLLSETAQMIDQHNLNLPMEENHSSREIHALTHSFDSMLSRLDKAFSAQKHFAASAAHELKTPLTIIKSSIQVLQMDENPSADDYAETLRDIEENVDGLSAIVQQLLLLDKQEEGFLSEIQPKSLLYSLLDGFFLEIAEKELSCSVICEDFTLFENQILLESVLKNLLSNAIKYNRQGGEISLSGWEDSVSFYFKVSDTGCGIAESQLSTIFQPFYRCDPSRSQDIPGVGLGLSIVQNIVDKLGGEIKVESALEEGTTVILTLPKT